MEEWELVVGPEDALEWDAGALVLRCNQVPLVLVELDVEEAGVGAAASREGEEWESDA